MMRKWCLLLIASMLALGHSTAHGVVLLPDPISDPGGFKVASDDPNATPHPYGASGDFVAYSTDILQQLQTLYPGALPVATFGSFAAERTGAGVGGIDALIYAHPAGQTNTGGLPDPLLSVSGGTSSFSGTWGDGSIPGGNTATVGEVLSFLPAGSYTPVFAFDNSEDANRDVTFSGSVQVIDSVTHGILGKWDFGTTVQPGELKVKSSTSAATLTGLHNSGSGIVDFWAYAPTMVLTSKAIPGLDSSDLFIVSVNPTQLDGGGDELFIANNIAPEFTKISAVPEPGSIAVFSLLGLVGGVRALRRGR